MSGKPESNFPTINDAIETLTRLAAEGLGDLPLQIIIAPDSTLQAIARTAGATDDSKPALMAEFDPIGGRLPLAIVNSDRWDAPGTPRTAVQ